MRKTLIVVGLVVASIIVVIVVVVFGFDVALKANTPVSVDECDRQAEEAGAKSANSPIKEQLVQSMRYTCYSFLAEDKKDVSVCDKISKDDVISLASCYAGVSYAMGDISICNKLSDPFATSCYSTLANRCEMEEILDRELSSELKLICKVARSKSESGSPAINSSGSQF